MSARIPLRKREVNPAQKALAFKKRRVSLSARRRTARNVLAGLVTVALVAIVGGIVYVARLPALTVTTLTVEGTHYTSPSSVERVAHDATSGFALYLIPRASSVLFSSDAIRDVVIKTFAPIEDVTVRRTSLTAAVITVTERTPVARWCSDTCYLMDAGGTIFAPTSATNFVVYRGAITGDPIGATYLGGRFSTLATLVTTLTTAIHRGAEGISVDDQGDVTLDLVGGGSILFALDADPAVLADNVTSTFASRQFKSGQAFDYADFRFGNKVYVKWK